MALQPATEKRAAFAARRGRVAWTFGKAWSPALLAVLMVPLIAFGAPPSSSPEHLLRARPTMTVTPMGYAAGARRLSASAPPASGGKGAADLAVETDATVDSVQVVRSVARQVMLPEFPTLQGCGSFCLEVKWLPVGHVLPRSESIQADSNVKRARLWAFISVYSLAGVVSCAILEIVNHVYKYLFLRPSQASRDDEAKPLLQGETQLDQGEGGHSEAEAGLGLQNPTPAFDKGARQNPEVESGRGLQKSTGTLGESKRDDPEVHLRRESDDRLFSAFQGFYHTFCWFLAVSASFFGYINEATGIDWEFFLLWQGLTILVHCACFVARLCRGGAPLPMGKITTTIGISLAPGVSESLDALRDPIVAMIFLQAVQSGLMVGYLSAALTLMGAVLSAVFSLHDSHAHDEHKSSSSWTLYFLQADQPTETAGDAALVPDGAAGGEAEGADRALRLRDQASGLLRSAGAYVAGGAAKRTSPLHQILVIYEEIPQFMAILLFALFGGQSSFVEVIGVVTLTKIVVTLLLRPHILAWQSTHSMWANVSPGDVSRAVRVSIVDSSHLIGCCCSIAADADRPSDTRAAALRGLKVLLGRDPSQRSRNRLREVLTSKAVMPCDRALAKDVGEPVFHDADHMEKNFEMACRLHQASDIGAKDICRVLEEMLPDLFVYWPLANHIDTLRAHESTDVQRMASTVTRQLQGVVSSSDLPAPSLGVELIALLGQLREDEGELCHEPGDTGRVSSDVFADDHGVKRIKVTWHRTGRVSDEMVGGNWVKCFKIVGAPRMLEIGDEVEALPGCRCEREEGVVYEPGDVGRVVGTVECEVVETVWDRSGLDSSFLMRTALQEVKVVKKAHTLMPGDEVEALPGSRFEANGTVYWEPGDAGRVSSDAFINANGDKVVKISWYRSGLTHNVRITTFVKKLKLIGEPHAFALGDQVEALPGQGPESDQGAPHEPRARGVVSRLPDGGDDSIRITWLANGRKQEESLRSWMKVFRLVGPPHKIALGEEVEAFPGSDFVTARGVVYYEPGDAGRVSTAAYTDSVGHKVVKVTWYRSGLTSIMDDTIFFSNLKVIGEPHAFALGDQVEALPGQQLESDQGAVYYEPEDTGTVSSLPFTDEGVGRIGITWRRSGLTTNTPLKEWMTTFKLVRRADASE